MDYSVCARLHEMETEFGMIMQSIMQSIMPCLNFPSSFENSWGGNGNDFCAGSSSA